MTEKYKEPIPIRGHHVPFITAGKIWSPMDWDFYNPDWLDEIGETAIDLAFRLPNDTRVVITDQADVFCHTGVGCKHLRDGVCAAHLTNPRAAPPKWMSLGDRSCAEDLGFPAGEEYTLGEIRKAEIAHLQETRREQLIRYKREGVIDDSTDSPEQPTDQSSQQ